jgi:hypothetical protein
MFIDLEVADDVTSLWIKIPGIHFQDQKTAMIITGKLSEKND